MVNAIYAIIITQIKKFAKLSKQKKKLNFELLSINFKFKKITETNDGMDQRLKIMALTSKNGFAVVSIEDRKGLFY